MQKKKFKPLYVQIVFVLLAFIIMVYLSYLFSSKIVHGYMVSRAESIIDSEKTLVETVFNETEIVLDVFCNAARNMILQGYDFAALEKYIWSHGESGSFGNIYGYFKTKDGKSGQIGSSGWIAPDDYVSQDRVWYIAAVNAEGRTAEVEPFENTRTGELVYALSRALYDDSGYLMAVVTIDLPAKSVAQNIVETALSQGGYGMLVYRDFTILSHQNPDFVGMSMTDPAFPGSPITDELAENGFVFEYKMISYLGEESLAFFQQLPNGWYIGFVTPEAPYYKDVSEMAGALIGIGMLLAVILILFLIQLDRSREKADEESKYKSAFLANMSHEIRTPMNAIIGMTVIAKAAEDMPRMTYCLDKIENASQHLLGVINDILDMSKIEANKFELSYEEFEFEKMLQRVVSIVGFRADERKQKLTVHVDKSIPHTLIGDDQRLAQVITNLLGNAVKFTPEGGAIKLDTRFIGVEDDVYTIRVTITDTGIGISPEQQKTLFSSFQQAESGTSRKFGGTGLGLAISKNIVKLMGGEVGLESEIGIGSSFWFTFKVKKGTRKAPSLSEIGINWENVSIMAVDDDREVLDYFSSIIKSFGTSCDTAISGMDALALVGVNGMYDIYFVDWKMPDMDGIALARELKAKSEKPDNTIVIMISAAEWSEIADEAKKAGVDKFLSKPLFPSAIADAITEAIGINTDSTEVKKSNVEGLFKEYKILLAEDVEINREILMALLEATEISIDCAENGAEAVTMFEKFHEKYDLIFMDLQMPKMDGYEATKKIRESSHPEAKTVPIIAMTANVFKEDIESCLEAGMDGHVGKPIDIEEVFNILRKYLLKTGN